MLEFMHKAAKVTDDIMTCFAIGLGLPEDFYKQARCIFGFEDQCEFVYTACMYIFITLAVHTAQQILLLKFAVMSKFSDV